MRTNKQLWGRNILYLLTNLRLPVKLKLAHSRCYFGFWKRLRVCRVVFYILSIDFNAYPDHRSQIVSSRGRRARDRMWWSSPRCRARRSYDAPRAASSGRGLLAPAGGTHEIKLSNFIYFELVAMHKYLNFYKMYIIIKKDFIICNEMWKLCLYSIYN